MRLSMVSCTLGFAWYGVPFTGRVPGSRGNVASARVHLPISGGDKENTLRYFAHRVITCSHSASVNEVLSNARVSAAQSSLRVNSVVLLSV